jgi:hypothetical protein
MVDKAVELKAGHGEVGSNGLPTTITRIDIQSES